MSTFRDECQRIILKLDNEASQGLDVLSYRATKSGSLYIHRRYWMSESALTLGEKINDKSPLNPKHWTLWMQCAEVKNYDNAMTVWHISPFFAGYAERELGRVIGSVYKKPIRFLVSDEIRAKVYQ